MWILRSARGEVYYLLPGKHTVGRKDCNLVLENDQSISRKHAQLEVLHPQENWGNPNQQPVAEVADSGSKYGSSVLSKNVSTKLSAVAVRLKDDDEIHFGLQWNKWKVSFEPLVVVMSGLSRQEKQSVKSQVVRMGGHIISDWRIDATHVTMSSITLTVKAISALAYGKPIVSPEFWTAYKTAMEGKRTLPKYEDFIPPLSETIINKHEVSFLINPKRRTLFNGKTFVFFSELQYKEHGCLVEAAGGKTRYIGGEAFKNKEFLKTNIVLMQYLSVVNTQSSMNSQRSQIPDSFTELSDFLKAHGKRTVPSAEIGLAIVHCSTEQFCNPDLHIFASMFQRNSKEPSQFSCKEKILATETQDISQDAAVMDVIIPDSGTESRLNTGALSEVFDVSDDSNTELPSERPAQQSQENSSEILLHSEVKKNCCDSKKRARIIVEESDDEVEELPPSKKPVQTLPSVSKPKNDSIGWSNSEAETTIRVQLSEDHDEMDDLFADFKEPMPRNKISLKNANEDESEDLFDGFQDDLPKQRRQSNRTVQAFNSPPSAKRELSSDDESGPPLKRQEKLKDVETKHTSQSLPLSCGGTQEQEFVSVSDVKQESIEKSSCNVSVIIKSLVVVKIMNTTVQSSASSVTENIKNFKKFRKVKPSSNSIIPRIIGGNDLEVFKNGARVTCTSLLHNSDSEADEPGSLWNEVTQPKNVKSAKSGRLSKISAFLTKY